jgi:hypothetical protein
MSKHLTTLQRQEQVNREVSKQKTIFVEVVYTRNQVTPAVENLENRLRFIDMDLYWDPCHVQVKVKYFLMWQLGVNFHVMAKATRFIIPVRMVYEWKSCK